MRFKMQDGTRRDRTRFYNAPGRIEKFGNLMLLGVAVMGAGGGAAAATAKGVLALTGSFEAACTVGFVVGAAACGGMVEVILRSARGL